MSQETEAYELVVDQLGNRWIIDTEKNLIIEVEWVTMELPLE